MRNQCNIWTQRCMLYVIHGHTKLIYIYLCIYGGYTVYQKLRHPFRRSRSRSGSPDANRIAYANGTTTYEKLRHPFQSHRPIEEERPGKVKFLLALSNIVLRWLSFHPKIRAVLAMSILTGIVDYFFTSNGVRRIICNCLEERSCILNIGFRYLRLMVFCLDQ